MDPAGDGNAAQRSEELADVSVKKEPPSPAPTSAANGPRPSELSRLFIVCGRGRNVDELRSLFSTCGHIKHLHLALDRSKKSRGFAFLQYEDPVNATAAIEKLDEMKLDDGHILKVRQQSVTVVAALHSLEINTLVKILTGEQMGTDKKTTEELTRECQESANGQVHQLQHCR
ncbi:hypothetical protein BBO99_00000575 [Phytophthora kernoviae]|uniref:RRM domain-containing protein n=2 Tax=Phytophthora kernoviae TaxID=325452 RepID=A0A3R7MR32_9STRA|nr:hypothetical protein G195_001439 [Phytophthora kernoviae 00238/432]KAG2532154.1 hypothetical protein JM16_000488 [Phytophthora kernoviae]KAG2533192.1 hypothetical protein JM18_000569 [Phytophthora kernoviae]RLN26107.1 hypothetical protein BBI17_000614 [Phytophthora kernoviae]RLN85454.1 hypothetical protein BBO99_00000575 [Phytophthora kernoviae]